MNYENMKGIGTTSTYETPHAKNEDDLMNIKYALVTGGSSGIGSAICERLAKDGINIIFSYNSSDEAAKEIIKKCVDYGVEAWAVKADVSKSDECDLLVDKCLSLSGGRIDILVNNAGITKDGLLMKMSDDDINQVINVNLNGTIFMARNVIKYMIKQKYGKIINLSSVVGLHGNAGQVNYSASKAGVIGVTKSLAKEVASRKINVNAVAPGMIDTKMLAKIGEDGKNKLVANVPFGEIGKPEDVANLVSFLASDESRYITGQVICVDGGMAI